MGGRLVFFMLRQRRWLVVALLLLTGFFGWHARRAQISYSLASVVSPTDPDWLYFQQFKRTFGEDGNVLVLGLQDPRVYRLPGFAAFRQLSQELARVPGVTRVLGLPTLPLLRKDPVGRQFTSQPLFEPLPVTQARLDSLLAVARREPLYQGQVLNPRSGATLLALTLDPAVVNSARLQPLVRQLAGHTEQFMHQTGMRLRIAGLPYIQAVVAAKVTSEIRFFLVGSVLVMALTLYLFFRSWVAVVLPLLVVLTVVVWTVGSLVLLGYQLTLLTGLLPTILVAIGLPNCTYLLARYYHDYRRSGNQVLAMVRVLRKIGLVTLLNNTTTAIGFLVFCFSDIQVLFEFGLVATLNIFGAFLVSFTVIPGVFTALSPPTAAQLRHLEARPLQKLLAWLERLVLHGRPVVYALTGGLLVAAVWGLSRVSSGATMVDDIPLGSPVRADLAFFQQQFGGVLPLEVVVDTGHPGGAWQLPNLARIDQLEYYLARQPGLTPALSLVGGLRTATWAFYNRSPGTYRLPDAAEVFFLQPYLPHSPSPGPGAMPGLPKLADPTGQQVRLSLRVADMGSPRLAVLLPRIEAQARRLFAGSGLQVHLTGTTLLFTKGTAYLIHTLRESLLLALGLVSLVVLLLFRRVSAVGYALVPNLVTLLLTGGLMGYLGIPLKPSTALLFSIALGIDGDNSLHLLAKYQQELVLQGGRAQQAIATTLREAGPSLLCTSLILLLGFGIFIFSDFGGTQALGLLMGVSLLLTNFSNLVLLPCLLLTFAPGRLPRPRVTPLARPSSG